MFVEKFSLDTFICHTIIHLSSNNSVLLSVIWLNLFPQFYPIHSFAPLSSYLFSLGYITLD